MTPRKRVFIDAGVLIAAARGTDDLARRAIGILDDPDVEYGSSIFVQLEVLPKAIYNGQTTEAEFYETYFQSVGAWAVPDEQLAKTALSEGTVCGLSAIDALHVASAVRIGAIEFVTSEKSDKPLHRTRTIAVRSIAATPQ
ncbi:MAG: PIN domain-containing protein [Candidatus Lambdaproteobacteria bacterium]|nr:PIN domain-containing protein [Candidatus Lambdaproteobacteria bacterium]